MLNIVLYQPEIHVNTGNIIRTCYALGAKLHIIKPIGFDLHPKWLKRAGAGRLLSDIEHEVHDSYQDFANKYKDKNIYYITRYGLKTYDQVDFKNEYDTKQEIWLMFGRESTGIDKNVLKDHIDNCLRIPMVSAMRSINLGNCVSIISFEVMRQLDWNDLSLYEVEKGKDFLLKHDNFK
ncbi:tRNA (cytidine(34)-2'-O)-methyltransferase [Mycoplasma nasistruthionis]|uniref:Putative tRNA (cytidine(34)-2'-O)-methyltransferase n=1 Tax=Mycoplasma nasistruthionis TaxID=353852 RepID=A0A4Y6I6D8_9MOLU|nr:tRNA (cytidine(34)-2'-O)-methyltransferase [Mycoplasma nasistruthionis]QCZ36930.1 tRNA (cytidine(34)-2'-O)-methyltransferase [Mycoplasma nasistruthionis]QDF65205.1 tRNA (cytidine(34)-2'-O)-methyltransferase [Mycoplasma nasistruthionis]